jgi:FixJ family two-component response regulator
MLSRVKDVPSPFAAHQIGQSNFEFLVVCSDNSIFKTLAAAIRQVNGRMACTPHVETARDYVARRKVDGIVIDMSLPGAMDLIGRVRGSPPNRSTVVFACMGRVPESQFAIRAGANFVLHQPYAPARVAGTFSAATAMMVAEKRRHFRYPLMVPVELNVRDREMEGTMSNLSEGGMAIWSLFYYAPGTTIEFAFELPFGGLVRGTGEVAWTNADGLTGIKFDALPDRSYTHLSGWIVRSETKRPPSD